MSTDPEGIRGRNPRKGISAAERERNRPNVDGNEEREKGRRLAWALYALVGERVRTRRIALGVTQTSLAAAVGIARTGITNLEMGNQMTPLHTLLAVAGELRLEIGELMPKRAELLTYGVERVPLPVGEGEIRMVSPKTASAIARLMAQYGGEPR